MSLLGTATPASRSGPPPASSKPPVILSRVILSGQMSLGQSRLDSPTLFVSTIRRRVQQSADPLPLRVSRRATLLRAVPPAFLFSYLALVRAPTRSREISLAPM